MSREREGRQPRRGAYLLPSLLTTSNILLGFYAVISGIEGEFGRAAMLVFIAAFLDMMDGRIARMMGTESDFGKEYDSLADLFTFGAAPALLSYVWGLHAIDRAGWLIPLFYMVCAAVRLARFNVQTKVVDTRYFVGLPTPAAAGVICSLFFFAHRPENVFGTGEDGTGGLFVLAAGLVVVGVLMVSTFRYWSLKQIDFRQKRSYRVLALLAAVLLILAYRPTVMFLVFGTLYAAMGPIGWLWGRLRPGRSQASSLPETGSRENP